MSNWTAPSTFATNAAVTSSNLNTIYRDNLQALSPVGSYIYFCVGGLSTTEHLVNGSWLECNGAAVSRTTYSALFAVVSTTYGAGDGSTTFNIPDLRGRMAIGAASGGHADVNALGDNDGTTITARRPRHSHTASENTHNHTAAGATSSGFSDGHQHTAAYPTTTQADAFALPLTRPEFAGNTTHPTTSAGAHTHGVSAVFSGASAHPTVGVVGPTDAPAYLVAGAWLIKVFV